MWKRSRGCARAGLKGATALSQAIITGGALASVVLALPGRHPSDPAKPLIDYGTALMLTPVLLLGVSIGAPHGLHSSLNLRKVLDFDVIFIIEIAMR